MAQRLNPFHFTLTKSLILLPLIGGFLVSGCSVQTGAAKIEQGFSILGDAMLTLDEPVYNQALAANEYRIWQDANESFKSFDSIHFRSVAKELCPIGYIPLSRQALKMGELSSSDTQCNGACQHRLEWHIRCQDIPEEPFTLFGKT
ncbi:MAG: hypothetical protein JXR44_06995 [Thiotrichales bacterium]|nr:hypothetical protein [Thiotrichales bacterium]